MRDVAEIDRATKLLDEEWEVGVRGLAQAPDPIRWLILRVAVAYTDLRRLRMRLLHEVAVWEAR